MRKLRLHLYIVLGVFLICFIIGSFADLSISKNIFSDRNTFGIIASVIGTIPCYGGVALMGGMFFGIAYFKKDLKTFKKVLIYLVTIALFVVSIYFSGREFFSFNGFNIEKLKWLGFVIVLPIMGALSYLGYRLMKNNNDPRILLILIVISIAIFIALIPGTSLLKVIFHRPRFRMIEQTGCDFFPWWQRFSNYSAFAKEYNVASEEFKSFPSGHATACVCALAYSLLLPFAAPKTGKYQLVIFYSLFAWAILISFTRILVGAHFLSDVSMGGIIASTMLIVANEVLIHAKFMKKEELVA